MENHQERAVKVRCDNAGGMLSPEPGLEKSTFFMGAQNKYQGLVLMIMKVIISSLNVRSHYVDLAGLT